MTPLLSLGQDAQHAILGHVRSLASALAPQDADSYVNGTITFLMYR